MDDGIFDDWHGLAVPGVVAALLQKGALAQGRVRLARVRRRHYFRYCGKRRRTKPITRDGRQYLGGRGYVPSFFASS